MYIYIYRERERAVYTYLKKKGGDTKELQNFKYTWKYSHFTLQCHDIK